MAAEGPQQRQALKDGEERTNVSLKGDDFDWPRDELGWPMVKITAAAAELVPTVQYGNVTVGPVTVTGFERLLRDDKGVFDEDDLVKKINRFQAVCERAVAEERKSIQILMRARADRPTAA